MKKIAFYLLSVIAFILLIIIGLHLAWYFQKPKTLNLYILDKTVTQADRIEHKSLVWLLNHFRIVGPDGKSYNHKTDYWGFFPIDLNQQLFDIKSIRLNEVDAYAAVYDAAYYADCYGVYSYEWYKTKTKTPNSSKVYGGLNQNDYLLLKRMKELDKLIIGEYNMFSSPTNALIRTKTEELFNVTWTGWAGKYCSNLGVINYGKGPAEWMIKLYEKQHHRPWPSKGSGIILISNDGLIDVLEEETHLQDPKVKIVPETAILQWSNNPKDTEFYGWFDIIIEGNGSEVYASFKLETTPEGEEKLKSYGLKNQFPAVVKGHSDKFCYYFAGDFAENNVSMATSKLKGGKTFNKLLHLNSHKIKFFNDFYLPLLKNIISHYTENQM
ncbi:MAG TPA: hypothetical protein ENN49_05615 [Bacteroidales bacterium]|nr:hypothetical protein [Bacteroidales bacterium]